MPKIKRLKVGARTIRDMEDTYLWDTEIRGFGVRSLSSGAKTYIYDYTTRHGRRRRMRIGDVSAMPVAVARKLASAYRTEVESGGDPMGEREQDRRTLTVNEFWNDVFLPDAQTRRKPGGIDTEQGRFDNHIKPVIGPVPLPEVGEADIEKIRKRMGTTTATWNRVRALLSSMFGLAVRRRLYEGESPVKFVAKNMERKRTRYMDADELKRLSKALAHFHKDGHTRRSVDAIRMILFTGARRGEILSLRWDQVDFRRGVLMLEDSKTGPKEIVLNAAAVAVLKSIKRESDHVFYSPWTGGHIQGVKKVWAAICQRADLKDLRIHDLRHAHASIGVALNLGLPIIGGLLGHRNASTTQRYAHLGDDPARAASEAIGNELLRQMGLLKDEPEKEQARVVDATPEAKDAAE